MASLLSDLVGVAAVCVLAFIKWRFDRKVRRRLMLNSVWSDGGSHHLVQRLTAPGPPGVPIFYNFIDAVSNNERIYDWTYDMTIKVCLHLFRTT
jgi:hypothetical protein